MEFFQVANNIDKKNWVNNPTLAPYADAYFDAMIASADDADPKALVWIAMSYIYGTEGSLMRMASPKNQIGYNDVASNMGEFLKTTRRAADLDDATAIRQFAIVQLSGLKSKISGQEFITEDNLLTGLLRRHEPFEKAIRTATTSVAKFLPEHTLKASLVNLTSKKHRK